ncbi:MAG: PAS domain S-box protein, partial [Proteobacteria bacterium]|nr:PAS domain S-box protein [Pseudomonadota bacterium]
PPPPPPRDSDNALASSSRALRERAEAIDEESAAQSSENIGTLSSESAQEMLHELRVHQIELELQNEELRRRQVELEALQDRYFNLYEFAPVGYCSMSAKGLILKANLAATTMLGVVRVKLVGQRISRFIRREDQDVFYSNRKQLLESGKPQTFELRMVKYDGTPFWAHLEANASPVADGSPELRFVLTDITKRKQTESALHESEARSRDFSRSASDWFWETDAKYRFCYFSDNFEAVYGLAPGRLLGKSRTSLLEGDALNPPAMIEAHVAQLDARVPFRNFEYQIRVGDGDIRWVEVSGVPYFDVDSHFCGYRGIGNIITVRKHAEEMLVESAEELRRANENFKLAERAAKAGAYSWNFKTGETKWSAEFFRLFGLDVSNNKASYQTFKAALHPEDLQKAEMEVAAAIRDRKPFVQEYRVVLPGGGTRWIAGHGELVCDDAGQPQSLTGFCIDITKSKEVEEALHESERFARTTVDALTANLAGLDEKGTIIAVNRGWHPLGNIGRAR